MSRTDVPLWVAVVLKEQGKCNLVPPFWLSFVYLKEKFEEEKQNLNKFSQLPWNWQEIARYFLLYASDDLSDTVSQLHCVLQDLKEIRKLKAQRGLRELNESNVQLDGLSIMEINEIKPFVVTVMNQLRHVHEAANNTDQTSYSDDERESRGLI